MDIKIGKNFINKTWRFLTPSLRGYDDVFINKFNSVYKLAIGIHDTLLDGSEIAYDRNIYIMLDKSYRNKLYQEFIDYIKFQDYYITDYNPSSNLNSRKHMIVIKIPKRFSNAYDMFIESKYSKMYTKNEIDTLFSHPTKTDDKKILLKYPEAYDSFVKKVNKEFNCNFTTSNLNADEYELPLKKEEEIFNYRKVDSETFLIPKKDINYEV